MCSFLRRRSMIRRLVRSRRLGSAGVACALVAGGGIAAGAGSGFPTEQVRLHGASAWLASPQQGLVTLIDGASDEVAGLVQVTGAARGDDLGVLQTGPSAYVLNRTK